MDTCGGVGGGKGVCVGPAALNKMAGGRPVARTGCCRFFPFSFFPQDRQNGARMTAETWCGICNPQIRLYG
eukprot:12939041-Prorocentrum_lima.AAC.1